MYRMLKSKSEGLRDQVIDFAQRLVRTPSLSLDERMAADVVEREIQSLSFDQVLRDEVGNVVGIMRGRKATPTLLMAGHLDTVPAEEGQWSMPPFSGKIEGTWLRGLGAADCKGGIASLVYAAELLKRSLLPLDGNIVVAATVAEKNGLSLGMRALMANTLPKNDLKPNFAVLGEPTCLGLYYGHDGWMELDINIEGADPFHVEDAAQAVYNFLGERCQLRARGNAGAIAMVRAPRLQKAAGLCRATVALGHRIAPTESVAAIINQVQESVKLSAQAVAAVAVDVVIPEDRQQLYTGRTTVVSRLANAWSIDPYDPLVERARQSLAAAGCAVRTGTWHLERLGMGTSGGVLVKEFNVPAIGYGPGDEAHAHAADECVDVNRIAEAVYGAAAIAHGLVGVPVFGWTTDEI